MTDVLSIDAQIDHVAERIRARLQREKMTSLQRYICLGSGQVPDRMPIFIILDEEWCAHYLGYRIDQDFVSDPKKLAHAGLLGCDRLESDICDPWLDCYVIGPDAMGAKVYFHEDSLPEVIDPPVKSAADLAKLKIPDPHKDGRLPVQLEAARICQEKAGDILPVYCALCGPFSWAANMRGIYDFLADLKRNRQFAHDLLDICTEAVRVCVLAYNALGLQPFLADATASTYLISPRQIEEFVIPYYKKLQDQLGPTAFGGMIWGEYALQVRGFELPVLRGLGVNNYRYSQAEGMLEESEILAGRKVADDCGGAPFLASLWGRWVQVHTPREIDEEVKRVIGLAGPKWPFVVGLWNVPMGCPIENVDAFVRAVKKYGTFAVA